MDMSTGAFLVAGALVLALAVFWHDLAMWQKGLIGGTAALAVAAGVIGMRKPNVMKIKYAEKEDKENEHPSMGGLRLSSTYKTARPRMYRK